MRPKTIWTIAIVSLFVILSIVAFLVYNRNINFIIRSSKSVVEFTKTQNVFVSFLIFMLLQLPHHVFLLPGTTLCYIITAYIYRDFWYSFFLLFATMVAWTFIIYYLYGLFKRQIVNFLADELIYKAIEKKIKEEPLKTTLLVRFLYLPQVYKNIVLVMLNVGLPIFVVTEMIACLPTFVVVIMIGMSISRVEDFYSGKVDLYDPKIKKLMIVFIVGIILSVAVFVIMAWNAYHMYERLKAEVANDVAEVRKGDELHANKDVLAIEMGPNIRDRLV